MDNKILLKVSEEVYENMLENMSTYMRYMQRFI